jgi:hypothetical protein
MLGFMKSRHEDILNDIRDNPKAKLDDDMTKRLNDAFAEFDKQFEGETVET